MKGLIIGLGVALLTSASALAAERAATASEIKKYVVGHDVNCGGPTCHYGADGSYSYNGQFPWKYRISAGTICVNFDNGEARCDKILIDGTNYTLVNSGGQRYSFARN